MPARQTTKWLVALLVGWASKAAATEPPRDPLAEERAHMQRMYETVRNIVALQDAAKVQKDVIRLNCVNDKLLQVKGHVLVAEVALQELEAAVATEDLKGSAHEHNRIEILYQK